MERSTVSRAVWAPLLVIGLCIFARPTPTAAAEMHVDDWSKWYNEVAQARCKRCDLESGVSMVAYPGCIVSVVLDLNLEKSWRVTLIILAVFFAIFVRQALKAVHEGPLTPLVLFVILLFGAIWRHSSGDAGLGSLVGYAPHAFFSALAAGVLTFWTRYVFGLLPVAAVAGLVMAVAGIVAAIVFQGSSLPVKVLEWFSVTTGIVGGAWLFWRGVKKERAGDGSAQAVSGQSGPLRNGGASSDGGGGASCSSQSGDG